jgi:hypothetical protein
LNGHYFGLISAAIETRFAAVLHDKDLMTKYQSPEVMSQIMNGLEVQCSPLYAAKYISSIKSPYLSKQPLLFFYLDVQWTGIGIDGH